MPKQLRAIPDALLIASGVHDLDPQTPLIAAQAGLLLGRSKTRMDSDRRDGKPPPFYKDGSKVWYRLGGVLATRAALQDQEVATAQRGQPAPAYDRFSSFLTRGASDDQWPMALVEGRLEDFFGTLGQDVEDADWWTLEDILIEWKRAASAESAARLEARLRNAIEE